MVYPLLNDDLVSLLEKAAQSALSFTRLDVSLYAKAGIIFTSKRTS